MHQPRSREMMEMIWRLGFRLILLLSVVVSHGQGGKALEGTEPPRNQLCMDQAWSSGDGKVVLYDTVLNVASKEVYFIGPHQKLWIVRETPDLQARTIFFPDTFQQVREFGVDSGSTCTFSFGPDGGGGKGGEGEDEVEANMPQPGTLLWRNRTTAATFLRDPIRNINVAHCPISDSIFARIQSGTMVRVQLRLLPINKDDQSYSPILPVCAAAPAENPPNKESPREPPKSTLPAYASICCIIRDEGRYLVEWIEYSRMMGVEHFFFYDHASTDETRQVLEPYVQSGVATVHNWSWQGYPQREAHMHCTHRYAHLTTWLGLFDVDEFIVPVKADTLVPLLETFSSDRVVLRLSSLTYGDSGHIKRPAGLVLENYEMRNVSSSYPHNPQHKMWFQPGMGHVVMPSIHGVDIFASGDSMTVDVHQHDCYYNHYRSKSHQDHSSDPLRSSMPMIVADEVRDTRAKSRFLAKLRVRLGETSQPPPPPQDGQQRSSTVTSSAPPPRLSHSSVASYKGHVAGSTYVSQSILEESMDPCPETAHAISQLLDRDIKVIDVECGTCYFSGELRQLGLDAIGSDSEGGASVFLDHVVETPLDAMLQDKGQILVMSLSRDNALPVLENAARHSTGRIVIAWPRERGGSHSARMRLFELGFALNMTATSYLQAREKVAHANVVMFQQRRNMALETCRGEAELLVFDRSPMLEQPTLPDVTRRGDEEEDVTRREDEEEDVTRREDEEEEACDGLHHHAQGDFVGRTGAGNGATEMLHPRHGTVLHALPGRELRVFVQVLHRRPGSCAQYFMGNTHLVSTCATSFDIVLPIAERNLPASGGALKVVLHLVAVDVSSGLSFHVPRTTTWWLANMRNTTLRNRNHATNSSPAPGAQIGAKDMGEAKAGGAMLGNSNSPPSPSPSLAPASPSLLPQSLPPCAQFSSDVCGGQASAACLTHADNGGMAKENRLLEAAMCDGSWQIAIVGWGSVSDAAPHRVTVSKWDDEAQAQVEEREYHIVPGLLGTCMPFVVSAVPSMSHTQSGGLVVTVSRMDESGGNDDDDDDDDDDDELDDNVSTRLSCWLNTSSGALAAHLNEIRDEERPREGAARGGNLACAREQHDVSLASLLPRHTSRRGAAKMGGEAGLRDRGVCVGIGLSDALQTTGAGGMFMNGLRLEEGGVVKFNMYSAAEEMNNDEEGLPPQGRVVDWLYARAVGPTVAVGNVERIGNGAYEIEFGLRRGGTYALEVVKTWRGLPLELSRREGYLEVEVDEGVRGMRGEQIHIVDALGSSEAMVGHVTVQGEGGGECGGGAWVAYKQGERGGEGGEWVNGVDECLLTGESWGWEQEGCSRSQDSMWTEGQCASCVLGRERGSSKTVFIGDSNCRDIYIEMVTCALGDNEPDIPSAQKATKHLNTEVPLPGGGSLDFVWCKQLDDVIAAAEGVLNMLKEERFEMGAEREGKTVVVLGFAIWEMVVHLVPLETFLARLTPLLVLVESLRVDFGAQVFWLTPVSRTVEKKGILQGEQDVRIGQWRVIRWIDKISKRFLDSGASIIDQYAPSDALPEAHDGVHIGLACSWSGRGNDQPSPGGKGVCRHIGRIIARAVLGTLLSQICQGPERTRPLTHTCSSRLATRLSTGRDVVIESEISVIAEKDSGCPDGWQAAPYAKWHPGSGAQLTFLWCATCFPVGSKVHVTVNEARAATCSRSNCNVPLTGIAPGRHLVQIDVEDTAEELVWQTRMQILVPRWPSSLLSNVALASNGGRAEAVYSQGGFPVQALIDGAVEEDPNNGWAYHGRLGEAIAMVAFNQTRIVRTISMVSGLARNDHHVTEFALWSTADPSPSLASSAEAMWQPMLCSCVKGGAVRLQGEGKYSVIHRGTPVSEVECDDVGAAAIRLQVLASDASNGNAVITEFSVMGL